MESSRWYPDLPQDTEDYIKESFDYSLGLPVSTKTLQLKLDASEEARRRLQDQYFLLHSRLKEKDESIEMTRSEASMNAQALKRFVEENQKLAAECTNLLTQCSKWEKECALYDRDREALMEFANEADERAKDAEVRVLEAQNDLQRLTEDVDFYKTQCQIHMESQRKAIEELQVLREKINELEQLRQCSATEMDNTKLQPQLLASTPGGVSAVNSTMEESLLDSVIFSLIDKDRVAAKAHTFLEANSGVESCQRLLKMWDCLRFSTQNIIALGAEVNTLQNVKEHLRINLTRAEEEVRVLAEENNILDEENKKLVSKYSRRGSGGKYTNSLSAKGNKRKSSSPKICRSVERVIDFVSDSPRRPLSPLQYNSPNLKAEEVKRNRP